MGIWKRDIITIDAYGVKHVEDRYIPGPTERKCGIINYRGVYQEPPPPPPPPPPPAPRSTDPNELIRLKGDLNQAELKILEGAVQRAGQRALRTGSYDLPETEGHK